MLKRSLVVSPDKDCLGARSIKRLTGCLRAGQLAQLAMPASWQHLGAGNFGGQFAHSVGKRNLGAPPELTA